MGTPDREARALIARLSLTGPPVDVEAVARLLGVSVEQADLGEDVSGVLIRKDNLSVIGVNMAHHPNRQRFTIAHELGHFRLHQGGTFIDKGLYVTFRDAESGSGTIRQEREANQFAAALLMPASWLTEAFRNHPFDLGDEDALSALSRQFEVSTQALSFRLQNLKLLAAS